jgi:hypothetical protein
MKAAETSAYPTRLKVLLLNFIVKNTPQGHKKVLAGEFTMLRKLVIFYSEYFYDGGTDLLAVV